jgi:non-canonical purine NTP pyrophosphatase (RdgB/HAM1 family)
MGVQELLFATGNHAKLAQLAFVVAYLDAPFRVVPAYERYGEQARYEERGNDAASIARDGAVTLAGRLGEPVVVEDTALYVEALGGEPGVRAGMYLKMHGRAGILEAMAGHAERDAEIVSAVAWASPEGDTQTWVRVVQGHIAERERWVKGLPEWIAPSESYPMGGGYNAIFIPNGSGFSLAEMAPDAAMVWGYREPNFCALLDFLRMRGLGGG